MTLLIYVFDLLIDHVGIKLGGRNIAVAHKLLQRPKVRTVLQQMHRKAVAQGMRRDLLFDTGLGLVIFEDLPESLAAHPRAADVDKESLFGNIRDHGSAHIG